MLSPRNIARPGQQDKPARLKVASIDAVVHVMEATPCVNMCLQTLCNLYDVVDILPESPWHHIIRERFRNTLFCDINKSRHRACCSAHDAPVVVKACKLVRPTVVYPSAVFPAAMYVLASIL